MKDSIIIPTVNLANLANNINKSPTSSNPCSPHTKIMVSTPYEYDGCMLCVNGTPSCLQKRRATWTLKLRVALYCLSVLHPEKKYFNLKKDIYTYVDSHWDHLSINTAKSDRWRKQVQDSLSHCRHFESGWDAMGCNGHWRLIQPLNPWSLPPDKEGSIYDDEEGSGNICLTPEAGLSPRTTKSPREDPLYRNFPKRRPTQTAAQHQQQQAQQQAQQQQQQQDDEIENRKRKANDEERFTEEELLLLKYSPMIFSDTPSPKCRTPRGNNPASISSTNSSTTSPSIIGNSPLLTAAGVHFSLSNFNNNLNLNGPIHTPPQSNVNNITILDNGSTSPPYSSSPSLQPNSNSNNNNTNTHSPPIPTNPFTPWSKNSTAVSSSSSNNSNNSSSSTNNSTSSPSKSPSLFGSNGIDDFKVCPLPNPFGGNNYKVNSQTTPGFPISNNSSLKVPSELLKSSIINNHLTQQAAAAQQQQAQQQAQQQQAQQQPPQTNGSTSPNSASNPPISPRTGEKLTKLQQQNLILNCTY